MLNKPLVSADLVPPTAIPVKIITNVSLVIEVLAFLMEYAFLILLVQAHWSNTMETVLQAVLLDTTITMDFVSESVKPFLISGIKDAMINAQLIFAPNLPV